MKPSSQNTFYFAYGSNLNRDELKSWSDKFDFPAPLTHPGIPSYLPDMRLCFDYYSYSRKGGALNIEPCLGQIVPGVLFSAPPNDWQVLDEKEGAPIHYQRIWVTALTNDGQTHAAQTYVVSSSMRAKRFIPPTQDYIESILKGYKAYGLDTSQLSSAARGATPTYMVNSLFTYGTLMQGESRHALLATNTGITDIRPAAAHGHLFDLGSYPGMFVHPRCKVKVRGELITLNDIGSALHMLDLVEGFTGYGPSESLFHRILLRVCDTSNNEHLSWAYALPAKPSADMIPSGGWRTK